MPSDSKDAHYTHRTGSVNNKTKNSLVTDAESRFRHCLGEVGGEYLRHRPSTQETRLKQLATLKDRLARPVRPQC